MFSEGEVLILPQIEFKDVALGYEGIPVVDGLDFKVEAGDYLCIVGENGSGKSTLVKSLLGRIKPMRGSIKVKNGVNIGYLPQQTETQKDFPASAREIVLSGCLKRSKGFFYNKAIKQLADDTMKKLGIYELRNKCYRELSGGQQQRVLLCRALIAAKELLLLDEPVTGLDPLVTAELYELLDSLNKEGVTVIMVTHDLVGALKHASHILHIGQKSIFFGSTVEYMLDEKGVSYAAKEGK